MSDIRDFCPLWGEWEVEEKLGEGSFGAVWKVKRNIVGGKVYYAAVKHISIPKDESEIKRLIGEGIFLDEGSAKHYYSHMLQSIADEIDAMHKLQGYTNIVAYEDHKIVPKAGDIGYDLFLRMELLQPLTERILQGMSVSDVVSLGKDIATAIDVLYDHNMIHRDIKPQNIFVNDRGIYKLGDYGTARALGTGATAMSRKGTYNYMSPEIYNNQKADIRADIYSLGLVLYRLLNGNRLPFLPITERITSEDSDMAVMRRISGEKIPAPKNADTTLSRIVLKACAYNPDDRYRAPEEMIRDLEGYKGKAKGLIQDNDNDKTIYETGSFEFEFASLPKDLDTSHKVKETEKVPVKVNEEETVAEIHPVENKTSSAASAAGAKKGPTPPEKKNSKTWLIPLIAVLVLSLIAGGLFAGGIIPSKPTETPVLTEMPALTETSEVMEKPTAEPIKEATSIPTGTPSPVPTNTPTDEPTNTPTPKPADPSTPEATSTPTPVPMNTPTLKPTDTPTPAPTNTPAPKPTDAPTPTPTNTPTLKPTDTPTPTPTNTPTPTPTATPTPAPTDTPTPVPTDTPTPIPSDTPTPETIAKTADGFVILSPDSCQYSVLEGNVQIEKYTGNDEKLSIPEYLDGHRVTRIAYDAFRDTSIVQIEIPDSITEIDSLTFEENYKLAEIRVSESNTGLMTHEGVLYSKKDQKLICCPSAIEKTSYKILDGTKELGNGAFFYCEALKSITIPDSVTILNPRIFFRCSSLTSITLPEGITNIESNMFLGNWSLKEVILPSSLRKISSAGFLDCESLESITIPDGVTGIEQSAFENCRELKNATVPASVGYISDDAFINCDQLTFTVDPGSYAQQFAEVHGYLYDFRDTGATPTPEPTDTPTPVPTDTPASEPTSTPVPASSPVPMAYGTCGENLTWQITNGVLLIQGNGNMDDYGWWEGSYHDAPWDQYRDDITKVIIEEGVTSIGSQSIYEMRNLIEVSLPESLREVHKDAFRRANKLEKLTFPEGVETLKYPIQGGFSLKEINLPASLKTIEEGLGGGYGHLEAVTLADGNTDFVIENGVLFDAAKETLILYPSALPGASSKYEIPDGVKTIASGAFAGCSNLTEIVFPDTLEYIGQDAFEGCENIESIILPDSLKTLSRNAFFNCTSLQTIQLSRNLSSLEQEVFRLTAIEELWIPESVNTIEYHPFEDCHKLHNVFIMNPDIEIFDEAFNTGDDNSWRANCPNLVIYCFPGSTAESYAQKYQIPSRYIFNQELETSSQNITSDSEEIMLSEPNTLPLGSIVTFGHYEQDGDKKNGAEPIEWFVMDKDDQGILLLSRYILDTKPFNTANKAVNWEKSTIRKWLNRDFLNKAFSKDEKAWIVNSKIDPADISGTDCIDQGSPTDDKVFLLSEDEWLNKYKDVFWKPNDSRPYTEGMVVADTHMTVQASMNAGNQAADIWLLRGPVRDKSAEYADSYVAESISGDQNILLHEINKKGYGIRPLIRISSFDPLLPEPTPTTVSK